MANRLSLLTENKLGVPLVRFEPSAQWGDSGIPRKTPSSELSALLPKPWSVKAAADAVRVSNNIAAEAERLLSARTGVDTPMMQTARMPRLLASLLQVSEDVLCPTHGREKLQFACGLSLDAAKSEWESHLLSAEE